MTLTFRQLEAELKRQTQARAVAERLAAAEHSQQYGLAVPEDPRVFLEKHVRFPHMVTRKPVGDLNAMQLDYLANRNAFQFGADGQRLGGKDTIFKCRKMRFTSLFFGLLLWCMIRVPGFRAVSAFQVAKDEILRPLRDRWEFMLRQPEMPREWVGDWERLRKGPIYYLPNGSSWVAVTAGASEDQAGKIGRSGDIDGLHLSEPQQYAWPDELFSSATDAMPPGYGFVVSEGTSPSSRQQWHARTFEEAHNGDPDALFDGAFFYPWFWDPLKRIPEGSPQYRRVMSKAFEAKLPPEALERERGLDLDNEQVAFRRLHYFTGSAVARRKARREHPEHWTDGFTYRGDTYWDDASLEALREGCRGPDRRVHHTAGLSTSYWSGPTRFVVVGVDSAQFGDDLTAGQYLSAPDGQQLAELHGRGLSSEIAECIVADLENLGVWERRAYVVWVERTSQTSGAGDQLIRELINRGVIVGRESGQRKGKRRRRDQQAGFRTTSISRPRIFDVLTEDVQGRELEDGTFEGPSGNVRSKYLASELSSIVEVNGRPEAGEDDKGNPAKDDLVMGYGIARWMLPVAPVSDQFVKEYNQPPANPWAGSPNSEFGIPLRQGGMD